MRTTIKISIFAVLLMLPQFGFSQSLLGYSGPTEIDVNGIFIGGTYTKAQVVAKWGEPTTYWSGESEFGLDEEYFYHDGHSYDEHGEPIGNLFRFSEDGVFTGFDLEKPGFAVYTAYDGGFMVGDHMLRLDDIDLINHVEVTGKFYQVRRFINGYWTFTEDTVWFDRVTGGIITKIWFTTSV
jgi:hypothetical protein